jgi:hypothetical protein
MASGALSPGIKRPGCEADHSPPTSVKVKKTWVYTSTPPWSSWHDDLLVKHRDKFTLFSTNNYVRNRYFLLVCSNSMKTGQYNNWTKSDVKLFLCLTNNCLKILGGCAGWRSGNGRFSTRISDEICKSLWDFSLFCSVPPDWFWDIQRLSQDRFLSELFKSIIHPSTRRYIFWGIHSTVK